ncbi:MAG: hypothetical protein LBR35_00030 [Rickettsiales bacterium]|jgi:uncharacterized protein YcbK (DUF882 family)|nr:hypothetical protein [Rickettsiales bacterium]
MLKDIKDDNGKILFSSKELQCKRTKDGLLCEHFRKSLKELRTLYGNKMTITSCCRSVEHNIAVGGAKNSHHIYDISKNIKTCAADIARPTGDLCAKLVHLALDMGFSVGIAKTFIHIDLRTKTSNKPQILFTY